MPNMTITRKLYIAYGTMACLILLLGGSSILILRGMSATTKTLGISYVGKMDDAAVINSGAGQMTSLVRGIVLSTEIGQKEVAEGYISNYARNEQTMRLKCSDMLAVGMAEKGTAMVNDIKSQLDATDTSYGQFLEKIRAGDMEGAVREYQTNLVPASKKIEEAGSDLLQHQIDLTAKVSDDGLSQVSHGYWLMTALLVVGVVVGLVLIFIIKALDGQLRNSAHDLSEGAQQVSSAAGHVSSSSQTLARATTDQAAMIEETSASAEEINSMAKRNMDSARSASLLVVEAVKNQELTSTAVDDCVVAMNQISESSTKIAKTLQVIDKIAFQTNILALNAAVEAARAGEAGMGFAVVAEEVRNLAQRCAAASEEISALIEQSLGNSDSGRAKIATLVASGAKVTSVFSSIKILVEEISLSGEEQGRGIEQIGRAIQQMEQGTQKNAANAEESAAAAEQLNAQSEQLQQVSSSLAAMVGAETRTSVSIAYRAPSSTSRSAQLRPVGTPRPVTYRPNPVFATGQDSSDDDKSFTEF
jgi:methyl-accepting chemotaxis protein